MKLALRNVVFSLFLGLLALAGCKPPPPATFPAAAPATAPQARKVASPVPTAEAKASVAQDPTPPVTEAPRLLTEDELAAGWIALFDGETLFGWKPTTDANWRVEDGTIVVDDGKPGLLLTTTTFSDYILNVEFKSAKGTNSGIFLHTPPDVKDPETDCYELNIADSDNPFPTCSLVKRVKTEGDFDSEDWQSYEVVVSGDQVTVSLDDTLVLEYIDPYPPHRGHIGLQLNQGHVAFRNIKLRPLETKSLFNGKDLTGWKTYPDMDSEFTVNDDGELNVKNGKGQLETEASYGDFVLQLECISNAEQLNSGIFFRCIPGDVMMGYESQIHNGFKDGDRRKPVDYGTGGIFRRVDARLVVTDDLKWFHKTLIADGPHIATWVNGYPVTDWTDDRKPDENPRRGLRTERGTIMIQGHDPATDLSFRNINIAQLPSRSEVTDKPE
ncbi:MAG: glycosyl hydrolase [Planctomycetaceae bacterium]|nr:glycosyl hydrolase [Planctomycetaceae bacterium]